MGRPICPTLTGVLVIGAKCALMPVGQAVLLISGRGLGWLSLALICAGWVALPPGRGVS